MKKIFKFVALLSLIFMAGSCGGGKTEVSGKTKLVVGLECNYAPFNWTENKKTDSNYQIFETIKYADGYDIQIAKKLADYLDMELVIKQLEWDALIPSIKSERIDLVIAGMSPTESRKIDIDFSNAYYTSEHVLLVSKNSKYANVTSVDELEGAKIGGQIGTIYDDIAHGIPGYKKPESGSYDKNTVPELITSIQSGLIDGTVLELPVAQGQVNLNSETLKMIRFEEGKGFSQLLDDETNVLRDIVDTDRDVSIGIKKGNKELLSSINDFLSTLSNDERNEIMMNAVENCANIG